MERRRSRWGFRVATDPVRGMGHATRSSVLAKAMGATVIFVDPGPIPKCLRDVMAEVVSEESRSSMSLAATAVKGGQIDGLILDSYDVCLGTLSEFVAVMDDFGHLHENASVVIAAGFHPPVSQGRGEAEIAAGPSYALVDRRYMVRAVRRVSHPPQILIAMGARDSKNVSAVALEGLVRFLPDARVTIVLGKDAKFAQEIRQMAAEHGARVVFGLTTDEIVGLLAETDVAIGAGGVSFLERLAVGVPNVLVVLSDNQARQAEQAVAMGVAVLAGHAGDEGLADAVGLCCQRLVGDEGRTTDMIARGHKLVDLEGPRRVGAFLSNALERWQEARA